MVYKRTGGKAGPALEAGAAEAESPTDLFEWADTLLMMLSGPAAIDGVLEPVLQKHSGFLRGKVLVNMGTTPPSLFTEIGYSPGQSGGNVCGCAGFREDACAIFKVFDT
jgi:3-hydroxyisobutyrate dehydrogenase